MNTKEDVGIPHTLRGTPLAPTLYEYTLLSGDAKAINAQLREFVGETWEPLYFIAGTVSSGNGNRYQNMHSELAGNVHLLMRRELR